MQSEIVEHDRFRQQVNVVGGGCARGFHGSIRKHIANLLMHGLLCRRGTQQLGAATRVIDQEERCRGLLVVRGPLTFAAAIGTVVDNAVGGKRTVRHHVQHQRHTMDRGVLSACTHTLAGAEILDITFGPAAAVVVVTAHLDGACTGEAVDHHLHHGSGLAKLIARGVVGKELR